MGSWTREGLQKYRKDCIARGGTLVPDPMMAVKCVPPPTTGTMPIPPGEKELHGLEPTIRPIHWPPSPTTNEEASPTQSGFTSNRMLILVIVLLVLTLMLSGGAAFMFFMR
jgi:hypothetical protein